MVMGCQLSSFGFIIAIKVDLSYLIRHGKRARVVEWDRLESDYTGNGIGGSNPPASAVSAMQLPELFYTEFNGKNYRRM